MKKCIEMECNNERISGKSYCLECKDFVESEIEDMEKGVLKNE